MSFPSARRDSGDVLSHDTVTAVLVLLKIDLFSCDEIEFPSDVVIVHGKSCWMYGVRWHGPFWDEIIR